MEINDLLNSANKKDIKKLIALLQVIADLGDDSEDTVENKEEIRTSEPTKNYKNTKSESKGKNKKSQNDFNNKFLLMPEKDMHKEDSAIDKKLNVHPPVLRAREFEPVEVTCRVCHRTESVHPSLVDSLSRYKCNNCSKNPG